MTCNSLASAVRVISPMNFLRSFKTTSAHLQMAPSLSRNSSLNSAKYPAIISSCRAYSQSSKSLNANASAAAAEVKEGAATTTTVINSSNPGVQQETGQVFLHRRHNMYVCWHPEVPFPYEMTKPIDVNAPITDSHLKVQSLTPVKEAFRAKHKKMLVQELIKLTYATKNRFFGLYGKSRRLVFRENMPNKQRRLRKYL